MPAPPTRSFTSYVPVDWFAVATVVMYILDAVCMHTISKSTCKLEVPMSDITTQAWPEFYKAGGTLKLTDRSYLERAADKKLPKAIEQHQFCYILTPRQMGKSSLMVRTKQQLEKVGVRSVIIDLTTIGTTQISVEQWYLGQLQRIVTQLHMQIDYHHWWQQQSYLGVVQRFTNF